MGVVCEYCGREYSHRRVHCPRCGTPNWQADPKTPETLRELRTLCDRRGVDLKSLHFHLNEDYAGAKAYGVFQREDGEFVAYKNHSDGRREIFYQGASEREAARALYARLCRSLHARRDAAPQERGASKSFEREKKRQRRTLTGRLLTYALIGAVILALLLAVFFAMRSSPTLLSNETAVQVVETVTSGS